MEYQKVAQQPENPFSKLIPNQEIAIVPLFTLESGVTLRNVPVAYNTLGKLNDNCNNVIVICHALTGSADVSDWWGPLIGGSGKAFDISRFFVVCLNSLGSPYGSASPVTCKDGDPAQERYGPEFPLTTIRDDVNLHKLILDDLGVRQIAAVAGGSMGGMLVLEYAYFGKDYVKTIVPIATSSYYSAWGISWGEAQRQSIYCDPKYEDGYYAFNDPPLAGLSAARMSGLICYRSRDSFQSRFGRNTPDPSRRQNINGQVLPTTPSDEHWAIHNDGHRNALGRRSPNPNSRVSKDPTDSAVTTDPQFHGATPSCTPPTESTRKAANTSFSAQQYLRYQGENWTLMTFPGIVSPDSSDAISEALSQISQPTLILGIQSDGLFTFAEQEELAMGIPDTRLKEIESPEGHDAFLLEFEQVNKHILEFFTEVLPEIMGAPGIDIIDVNDAVDGVGTMMKSSTFGEAGVGDITAW